MYLFRAFACQFEFESAWIACNFWSEKGAGGRRGENELPEVVLRFVVWNCVYCIGARVRT